MSVTEYETKQDDNDVWLSMFDQFLGSGKMILKTLSACKIPFNKYDGIEYPYTIGKERFGVIVKTRNLDTDKVDRTLIDIINGEHPSYQQLLDVTFNIGKNCKNRIIINNGEKEGIYPPEYEDILNNFITYINNFGQNIYQIQIDMHFITDFSGLKLLNEPPEKSEFKIEKIPELRQFQTAEFWQFYYYPKTIFYPMDESEKIGKYLFDNGHTVQYQVWEVSLEWNENGALFRIKEAMKNCINFHKTIARSINEIRSFFDDSQIKIGNDQENPELIIELNRIPDKYFCCLSEKQKQNLTECIMDDFKNIEYCMTILEAEGRPVEEQEGN